MDVYTYIIYIRIAVFYEFIYIYGTYTLFCIRQIPDKKKYISLNFVLWQCFFNIYFLFLLFFLLQCFSGFCMSIFSCCFFYLILYCLFFISFCVFFCLFGLFFMCFSLFFLYYRFFSVPLL